MERGDDRSGCAPTPPASLLPAARWGALALLLLGPARGHIAGSMGYATVSLYGGTVRYSLTLGPDALAAGGRVGAACGCAVGGTPGASRRLRRAGRSGRAQSRHFRGRDEMRAGARYGRAA